ncbi:MAG: hypothetical protein WCF92_01710 [bacterium]
MKKINVDIDKVPLGTFVKGRPLGQAREGYEYHDMTCQVVYWNTSIDIAVLLFEDGALDYMRPCGFSGKVSKKPKDWPQELEAWEQRKREFHIKAFTSQGIRPFDFDIINDPPLRYVQILPAKK